MSGWAEIGDERSHTVFLIMYAVKSTKDVWEGMKLDGEIIAAHSLWLIVTAFVLFDLPTSGIVTSLIGHRFAKDYVDFVKLRRRH